MANQTTSLATITRHLSNKVDALSFASPVTHVYNPLDYAAEAHHLYLRRFGTPRGRIILLGMNPGPFGMAQTGIPFGEIHHVAEWMGIRTPIRRPENEHPKRPVLGFECTRSEVSGRRLWGWAAETFGSPEAFFARFFVINYCPLVFMEASGRNRTPDKLPVSERQPLYAACDDALRATIDLLQPERVIGVGAFAEKRARAVLIGTDVPIGRILHPSPASPAANRGWTAAALRQLHDQGVELPP